MSASLPSRSEINRPGLTRAGSTKTRQPNLDYQTIFGEVTRKNRGKLLSTQEILAAVKVETYIWHPGTPDDDLEPIRVGYSKWLRKFNWRPGPVLGQWIAP